MKGKTCLVTGATSGIGLATARKLAADGATVLVHARNAEKGRLAVEGVIRATGNPEVRLVTADFASLASVRGLAEQVNREPRLDVLVNNAGGMVTKRTLTKDGYEHTFAVNYLAPFLLTNLLLDKLKASAPSRIVMVSSTVYKMGKLDFDDLMGERRYRGMRAYGDSKLAMNLFTRALAKRLAGTGVTVNALHPGGVRTEGMKNIPGGAVLSVLMGPFLLSPEQGAATSLYLAESPEVEGATGGYYDKCKNVGMTPEAMDEAAGERLWAESARLTGLAG